MKRSVVIILLVAALAFVCVGVGAVLFFGFRASTIFSNNAPFDVRNISSVLEESKTLKVDAKAPVTLKVADAAGDVSITGADVKTVQVKVVKTAYDSSQARADQEVKGIKYTIDQKGNAITLNYELPKSMNFSNNVNTVDFIVTVPNETTVDIDTNGTVRVDDTRGTVNIVTDFGDVSLQNIEGAAAVETQSGKVDAASINAGEAAIKLSSGFGNISLERASGKDMTLHSNSGGLELKDVHATGKADLSTDFGDIEIGKVSADSLSLETNSGKLTLDGVTLKDVLTAKSQYGEISLEQVKATSYDLETNSGSITINGASGKVKAHSGFGSVTVKNADSVILDLNTQSGNVEFAGSLGDGPHTVHTDFGQISLTLPADAALDVDLKTDFGKITSEIPITVVLSGELEKSHQTGKMNEGGALLTVETNSGNISILTGK